MVGCQKTEQSRPNIVFFLVDDHSYKAVSAYDNSLLSTPNIDRIANEGMRFDDACVTNAICAPSRTVILTGAHSHINGVIDNATTLDPTQPQFPKLMQESGYQTALIGKWHLKSEPKGFDYYDILIGQGQYYAPEFKKSINGSEPVNTIHDGYCTDLTMDFTLDWLNNERSDDKPFLLLCHQKAPHRTWMPGPNEMELFDDVMFPEPDTLFDNFEGRASPASTQAMTIANHMYMWYDLMVPSDKPKNELNGPDKWAKGVIGRMNTKQRKIWDDSFKPENELFIQSQLEGNELTRWKYQRYMKNYLRCIKGIDSNVGRLLDWLESNGLDDNTIVVYMSDQGFFLGEHGWYDKRFMYEPCLRVPFLVAWPEHIKAGSVSDALVQNLDIAPTFLDIAGVPIPSRMQGESLVPILEGEKTALRDSIYYHYYEFPGAHSVQKHEGVRTNQYKLISYYDVNEWEMFDFVNDPNEVNNLYGNPEYKSIQMRLEDELASLKKKYNVPEGENDAS